MTLKAKIKQYGLINSFKRAVKSPLRRLGIQYESFYLMVNHINPEELKQKMQHYDYSDVKELTYDDFKLGDPAVFTPAKMQLIQSRFENGKYWAYGIVDNNILAFSCWVNAHELQYPTVIHKTIPFNENAALLQDAYCHPKYRGKGYHSKMTLFRLYKIMEKNIPKAITIVLFENIPAYKTQLKSGFKVEKQIKFTRIFKKTYQTEKECYE
jgi:hypothetical protein